MANCYTFLTYWDPSQYHLIHGSRIVFPFASLHGNMHLSVLFFTCHINLCSEQLMFRLGLFFLNACSSLRCIGVDICAPELCNSAVPDITGTFKNDIDLFILPSVTLDHLTGAKG